MRRLDPDAIREAREQRGLTQAALAELVGTSEATISRAETGRNVPSAEIVARIAVAVGAPLESLFTPIASAS